MLRFCKRRVLFWFLVSIFVYVNYKFLNGRLGSTFDFDEVGMDIMRPAVKETVIERSYVTVHNPDVRRADLEANGFVPNDVTTVGESVKNNDVKLDDVKYENKENDEKRDVNKENIKRGEVASEVKIGDVIKGDKGNDVKQEGVKQDDVKQDDVKQDVKQDNVKQDDVKQDDVKQGDVKQGDVKQDDVKQGNFKRDDVQQGDVIQGDVKQDDVKQDVKQDDVKQGDVKQGDVKQDDVKQGDVKQGDVKQDDVKQDIKQDGVKQGDVKQDVKQGDVKQDDVKMSDVKMNDVKKEEVKQDDVKKDDTTDDVKHDDIKKDDVNKSDVKNDIKENAAKEGDIRKDGGQKASDSGTVLSEQCVFHVSSFAENTTCTLPVLDPFNEQMMKYLVGAKTNITCPGQTYTSYNDGVLSLLHQDSPLKNIVVHSIERKPHSDTEVTLTREQFQYPNQTSAKIDKEFLQVEVETSSGEKRAQFHAKVVAKAEVLQRKKVAIGLNYSVLIVGFDSTSSAQMQRAMPDVYKFLKDDLNSYIFSGYSIVGDGTTPQLAAMLTGKLEPDLPEARRGYPNSTTVDRWPWIFKRYRDHGYATLYSEDDEFFNTFNYRLHGFREPPTDHYSRPFWLVAPTENLCVRAVPQPDLHFSYIQSFMEAYRSVPRFGFAFLSAISHQSMTNLCTANGYALKFFKSLSQKGFLDDTILIVFGDHGLRFGHARALIQSRLEERLPFLSITLPPNSKLKHKEIHHFLAQNTKKLTSHFDMHATLRHILTYPVEKPRNSEGVGSSLFSSISNARGCPDSGIPDHYCPCVQLKEVDVTHPHIKVAAQSLVQRINDLLLSDDLSAKHCARLELFEIKSAYQNLNHPKMVRFRGSMDSDGRIPAFDHNATYYECNYALLVKTSPGGGLFEANAQLLRGRFHVGQHISRINEYGDQPKCIAQKRPYLRKFCYCKDM